MKKNLTEKCRDKQFEILRSVKNICEKANIRMFLIGGTAFAAYKGDFNTDDITVCIDAADIYKFMDAFESSKGHLVMDSMYTNGDFPAFVFRIYDPETIFFDSAEFMKYRYNSLFVRVLFIQHVPANRFKKAYLNSIKGAYSIRNQMYFGKRQESESRMVRLLERKERKIGRDETAKWVFEKLAKGYANDSESILLNETPFKANTMGEGHKVTVKGEEFLIPKRYKHYFEKIFGKKWEAHEIKQFNENKRSFRDPDHSWEELKERLSYMDFDGYYNDLKEYYAGQKAFSDLHKEISKYRDILTRTDMRFKLWQKYMPMKDELMSLHAKGDYEALSGALREYIIDLEECEKKGLGLCFDEDILNITLDIYRHQGDAEHADVLNSLVPPEHREVLHIIDYKGDVIA